MNLLCSVIRQFDKANIITALYDEALFSDEVYLVMKLEFSDEPPLFCDMAI